jgi:hypothetical protein
MASDIRGEAENASAAFLRLCQSENLFSHLAELLERRGVRELYSQAEVEEALNIERQLAQAEVIGESAEFFDAYGEPLWHAIALFCQRNTDRLTRLGQEVRRRPGRLHRDARSDPETDSVFALDFFETRRPV